MAILQQGWEKIPLGEGVKKVSNLMLIGHGAALLLIFNARIESATGLSLQGIAWMCGIGLIAAAIALMSAYYHDEMLGYLMRPAESESHRFKVLADTIVWTSCGMVLSGLLFVGALIGGITTLGSNAGS